MLLHALWSEIERVVQIVPLLYWFTCAGGTIALLGVAMGSKEEG